MAAMKDLLENVVSCIAKRRAVGFLIHENTSKNWLSLCLEVIKAP